MNLDLRFYLSLVLKRLPIMLILLVSGTAVGLGVAYTLPPRYEADAQLLVQGAQIEGSTVTVQATERLQILQQQLLTRATLLDMARQFDVFRGEDVNTPDEIVSEMRNRTGFNIRGGNRGRNSGATFLTINFTDDNARTAADVVNQFVTLVLAEDAKFRRNQAGQTLDFYEDEVERLEEELSQKSAEIVNFEAENEGALPSGNDFRLNRQSQLQEMVNTAARNRSALNDQRRNLVAMGSIGAAPGQAQESPEVARLRSAEAELANALTVYSETNPRVRILRSQVERLRDQVNASLDVATDEEDDTLSSNPATAALQMQISSIDTQLEYLERDVEIAEAELVRLAGNIAKTPGVVIRIEELNREYSNLQRQYDRALSERNAAQAGEKIELAAKGERLRVIEQASAPSEPNAPDRNKIMAGGFLAGGALAAAFFVLAELLNRSIRRPVDIVNGLGIQPLATIPFIETTKSRNRRRALWTILLVSLAIGIPIALWSIHEYYLPLDYIIERIIARLGL